nr:hypothetical protein [Tanacetum cinerariifolium]
DNNNANVIPCKVSHVDDSINLNVYESTIPSDPIVQSVDINTKSTSYAGAAGASAKDQPKVNFNFRTLVADPVFDEADLVDVVTIGIPSLFGDGFTKETICVEYEWRSPRCDMCNIFGHVHDHCPKKVVSPLIVITSNVVTPTVEKTNDGFQTVGKKRRGKATTSAAKKGVINVGNTSQSSSMLKTIGNSSKKDNLFMSNYFSALNDEEEDVENVYDESANLIQNTKAGGSSSFMAVVG